MISIREATPVDKVHAHAIFKVVTAKEDTYIYPKNSSQTIFDQWWEGDGVHAFVAEEDGQIKGIFKIKPNFIGLADHIANASYMVHPDFHGQGIGSKMCEKSLKIAKELGFKSMQFNIVISTNKAAVALWKKFGFEIIATIKNGYRRHNSEFVDAYIMFRDL